MKNNQKEHDSYWGESLGTCGSSDVSVQFISFRVTVADGTTSVTEVPHALASGAGGLSEVTGRASPTLVLILLHDVTQRLTACRSYS